MQKSQISELLNEKKRLIEEIHELKNSYLESAKNNVQNALEESQRLRIERDKMRELYEDVNLKLSNTNKKISILSSHQDSIKSFAETAAFVSSSHLDFIKGFMTDQKSDDECKKMIKEYEEQIATELESFSKQFSKLESKQDELILRIEEKDQLISKILSEV